MQCIPPASQGNLFVKGFDLRQQTTGLRRLGQIKTKSVFVCLYTEQACCGSPSRHSGSFSALKYRLRPLHWHDHYSWPVYGWKPTLNHTSSLGIFLLPYVGYGVCSVKTCDNLLLLPCGKLMVSLTRLEFLLHTYMAFSHVFKLFKVGFKSIAGLARHIHFACTDINHLFHII